MLNKYEKISLIKEINFNTSKQLNAKINNYILLIYFLNKLN